MLIHCGNFNDHDNYRSVVFKLEILRALNLAEVKMYHDGILRLLLGWNLF